METLYVETDFHRKEMTPIEVAEKLDDNDFKQWYINMLKGKGLMYWDPNHECLCDRCTDKINKIEDLRIMFGKRLHPACFELDVSEWVDKGKKKGYVVDDALMYFNRVINVLGSGI